MSTEKSQEVFQDPSNEQIEDKVLAGKHTYLTVWFVETGRL